MKVSHTVVSNSVTPWNITRLAPLSMEFSQQEYWSGLPFPSPGDLPNPGIEPASPALQSDPFPTDLLGKPTTIYRSTKISNTQQCKTFNAWSSNQIKPGMQRTKKISS